MVFSDEGKNLIKSLYLKKYTAKRFTDEFPEKSWTKRSVNRLLKKLWDTGTVEGRSGSGRPRSARTEENVETVNDLTSRCLHMLKYFKYSVNTLNNKYINTLIIQLHA